KAASAALYSGERLAGTTITVVEKGSGVECRFSRLRLRGAQCTSTAQKRECITASELENIEHDQPIHSCHRLRRCAVRPRRSRRCARCRRRLRRLAPGRRAERKG